MIKRRELKQAHEDAVLHQFINHLISCGSSATILDKPDPPEAIIQINQKKTWVEITDAFLDKDHAIGLTTGVCEDVEHMPDAGRLIIDYDVTFSAVLQSVIEAKYVKKSMILTAESQGSGILLVGIFTPFAFAKNIAHDDAENIANLIVKKSVKVFDTIYVYDGIGHRNFHIIYDKNT